MTFGMRDRTRAPGSCRILIPTSHGIHPAVVCKRVRRRSAWPRSVRRAPVASTDFPTPCAGSSTTPLQGAAPGIQLAVWRHGALRARPRGGQGQPGDRDGRARREHFPDRLADQAVRRGAGRSVGRSGQARSSMHPHRATCLYSRTSPHSPCASWSTTPPACMPTNPARRSRTGQPAPPGRGHRHQATPFDFPPGTAWQYSNANYVVLGAIIEQVTAKRWPRSDAPAVRAIGHDAHGLRPQRGHRARARGGIRIRGRRSTRLQNGPCVDVAQAGGAGAMRGNAEDLCRWHAALLDGRVVGDAASRAMLAPAKLRDGGWPAHRAREEDAAMVPPVRLRAVRPRHPRRQPDRAAQRFFYGFSATSPPTCRAG